MPELEKSSLPQADAVASRRLDLAKRWNSRVNSTVHLLIGVMFTAGILLLLLDLYNWYQRGNFSWVTIQELLEGANVDLNPMYGIKGWDWIIGIIEIIIDIPGAPMFLILSLFLAPITDRILTFNIKNLDRDMKESLVEQTTDS